MKILILTLLLALTGCISREAYLRSNDADIAKFEGIGTPVGGPSYIDQIRREGEIDATMNRLRWYPH